MEQRTEGEPTQMGRIRQELDLYVASVVLQIFHGCEVTEDVALGSAVVQDVFLG